MCAYVFVFHIYVFTWVGMCFICICTTLNMCIIILNLKLQCTGLFQYVCHVYFEALTFNLFYFSAISFILSIAVCVICSVICYGVGNVLHCNPQWGDNFSSCFHTLCMGTWWLCLLSFVYHQWYGFCCHNTSLIFTQVCYFKMILIFRFPYF